VTNRCLAPGSHCVTVKDDLTATEKDGDLHEVVQLLAVVGRRLRGGRSLPPALAQAFRDGSLGPRHMQPLFSLVMCGPASVGELASRLGLASATASLLVNDLDRAGLVVRSEDRRDRRRTIVSVPEEQRRQLQQMARERLGLVRRTLDRLEPEARTHFLLGLRILAEESAPATPEGSR
jgi:DNA-binding MarR family transcriptional regulator